MFPDEPPTSNSLQVTDLDDDSLVHIFRFLQHSLPDLDRLACVCRRFYDVITAHLYSRLSAHLLQTGHQPKATHCLPSRNLIEYDYRKRIGLFENWRYGRYQENQFFQHRMLYFSQIVLEKRWLYMSHRGQLRVHKRTADRGHLLRVKPSWTVGAEKNPDINWMVKKGELIFAGRADGTGFVYDCRRRRYSKQILADEASSITAVDFEGELFVSTSKASSTCFWAGGLGETEEYVLEGTLELPEAFQTVKLSPDGGSRLAAGKYHDRDKNALRLIDVERGFSSTLDSPSRAVYHLLWKDSTTILTGNFDTTLRMVDTRTCHDEAIWSDPYDASVYCLDYDGAYGVLCGLKQHFRVNLYDLRVPGRCVQMYFSSRKSTNYSPVYSLAADASQLFIVTDHDLRVLNFDADYAESKDYTYDLDRWFY